MAERVSVNSCHLHRWLSAAPCRGDVRAASSGRAGCRAPRRLPPPNTYSPGAPTFHPPGAPSYSSNTLRDTLDSVLEVWGSGLGSRLGAG